MTNDEGADNQYGQFVLFVGPCDDECITKIQSNHRGATLAEFFHCSSTSPSSLQLPSLNGVAIHRKLSDVVMISTSHDVLSITHTVIRSGILLKHIFKQSEGLCCTLNSVTTCFQLQVNSPPVHTVSKLSDVGCLSGTMAVVMTSAVSSFIKDSIDRGLLCCCETTIWTMACKGVRNHDILHCQWIKDSNLLNSNPKLSVTYGKCPMQTNQCKDMKCTLLYMIVRKR